MTADSSASTLWPPPEGFVPVPSQVEGIELYAPAPPEEREETRSFRCRYCGGVIAYSPAQRELACPYCGRTQTVEAEVVGRAAEEFEFTLDAVARDRYGWGDERRELACEACGAVVVVAPDALTDTCAFCGSHRVLARDVMGDVLRPTSLIPFQVDRERLQPLVAEWLGQGWMHPPELRDVRVLRELAGVYLPFWTFDSRLHARWKAEVGHEETERYFDDGEWKTRTVVRWRWQSGRVHVPVNDHLVPGTDRVSQVLLGRIEPFDLSALVAYEPAYLAGWQAKACDVALEEGWRVARDQLRERAKRACYADTGSAHVRNFRMGLDFADEEWRYLLLPVYMASYPFDERTFQVMVNGQTGRVSGQKPVAWLRVWVAIAAMLAPGACLGLIGLLTLALGGIGVVGLVLGFILFVAGLVGAVIVLRQAMAAEEV
jgi:predicted RNA-binding Zn-ribbon protein involved in translation (DUF1610 family)